MVKKEVAHLVQNCVITASMWDIFFEKMDCYDTCVLRLTRVRAQLLASMSVSRTCFIARVAALLSFSGSSLQAPSSERAANSLSLLAGAITSLSIGVVGNCLIGLLIGFALQPARVRSSPVPVTPTRENTPRPEPGVCGCGPCICREPSASQSQWSEKVSPSSSILPWDSLEVCTCVTLCCTHRSISREIIAAAQIVARRFQAHSSTFEKLSVELRGHVLPEIRPMPSIRVPLELEAGLLDSGVQELLGTEELAGNELRSSPLLQ